MLICRDLRIKRQNGDEECVDYCDCDSARGKRPRKIEVTVEATQKLVEQALALLAVNASNGAVDPPPYCEEMKDV